MPHATAFSIIADGLEKNSRFADKQGADTPLVFFLGSKYTATAAEMGAAKAKFLKMYPKTKVHCVQSGSSPSMGSLSFCDHVYKSTITGTELADIKQHICNNN